MPWYSVRRQVHNAHTNGRSFYLCVYIFFFIEKYKKKNHISDDIDEILHNLDPTALSRFSSTLPSHIMSIIYDDKICCTIFNLAVFIII